MEPPQSKISGTASMNILILACWLSAVVGSPNNQRVHVLEPRQSSDGCGQNPLVALMSYAREFADFSPQQLVRFIETDTRAWSQLRSLLRTYDDCVRTGDGTRYKRPSLDLSVPDENRAGAKTDLRDRQSWKRILRALVLDAGKANPSAEFPTHHQTEY